MIRLLMWYDSQENTNKSTIKNAIRSNFRNNFKHTFKSTSKSNFKRFNHFVELGLAGAMLVGVWVQMLIWHQQTAIKMVEK